MEKTENYGWTDAVPEYAGYINQMVIRIARDANARTVLDAGCGNGALAADLAAAGFQVVGVDGDRRGIEIARSKYPALTFEVALFDDAPAGEFDFVTSTEVIEHLYSPHHLARFCFSALRPGGTLAISTPYHGYLKNIALSLANKWDYHHKANEHGGHIKFWSRATLTTLLEEAGFKVTGFAGAGRFPYLWKSMILTARRPL